MNILDERIDQYKSMGRTIWVGICPIPHVIAFAIAPRADDFESEASFFCAERGFGDFPAMLGGERWKRKNSVRDGSARRERHSSSSLFICYDEMKSRGQQNWRLIPKMGIS